ncbi:hypothetical protein GGD81_002513 [Rhodobium orientis]|uniref:DUF1468 domain-containing protein n=1 Tax=Rhodobium orientis TaxID=34017 RepID=A0A327JS39_9HYPH|nr:tripartite tricarboxylate transporter TctB family protein [Rhodobium orientis]MBB4303470.1 hypothetical protein [Rhodobium orientis]MBK5950404.1 hypothetical protein [Rhodobium orientis]RAI28366.1 hypothetical protein CH339_07055 [Rhodobium orientis]
MTRVSWTTVIGAISLLIAAYLFYHTFDPVYDVSIVTAGRGPVFFPRILLALMLVLSLAVAIEGFRLPHRFFSGRTALIVVSAVALTGLYIAAITSAGFLISTVVYVFALPFLLGYRNVPVIGAVAAIYPLTVWYVFDKVFLIILPSSPWFDSF